MMERKGYGLPGPETKGGGLRGGPKRWTGKGPAPARHIPWPEIFKHHVSLIEGHLKMVDMVRKHTVAGSGNYHTISDCVERTKAMLNETKFISRTFVPPKNDREQVPLGSSSVSMYPGYSPADNEYGKAAHDYGQWAAEAKARGEEIKPPDVDYELGQAKGIKRASLAAIRHAKLTKGSGSGSGGGSESDGGLGSPAKIMRATNGASNDIREEPAPDGNNTGFFIDTKPTPVNFPGISHPSVKREASPPPEPVEGKKHKKAKKKHDGDLPDVNPGVEFEDITGEVDARLKEKEEKRRRKEEKKRKRESAGEPDVAEATPTDVNGASASAEKHKKKKHKHADEDGLADRTSSKKRTGGEDGELEDGEDKKKKKRKKDKTRTANV